MSVPGARNVALDKPDRLTEVPAGEGILITQLDKAVNRARRIPCGLR